MVIKIDFVQNKFAMNYFFSYEIQINFMNVLNNHQ